MSQKPLRLTEAVTVRAARLAIVRKSRAQIGGPPDSEHRAQLARKMTFGMRFPRRLAIKDGDHVEVYDTGNHRIFGVAQAQSADQTLTFTSQDGLVRVTDLPKA
jgi:hypothetical protein